MEEIIPLMSEDVDIGLILKKAFHKVFHDMGYIAIYLIPFIGGLFTLLFIQFSGVNLFSRSPTMPGFQSPSQMPSISMTELGILLIALGTYILIISILTMIAMIAVTIKADKEEDGLYVTASDALGMSFGYILSVIGAAIIVGLATIGPFLLGAILVYMAITVTTYNYSLGLLLAATSIFVMIILLIPAIYIGLRLSLYLQACVIDNLNAIESVKKCWHVTRGHVLLLFITLLILYVITIPFTLLNMALPQFQIGTLLSMLIVGPISAVTLTLIYRGLTGKTEAKPSKPDNAPIEVGQHNSF